MNTRKRVIEANFAKCQFNGGDNIVHICLLINKKWVGRRRFSFPTHQALWPKLVLNPNFGSNRIGRSNRDVTSNSNSATIVKNADTITLLNLEEANVALGVIPVVSRKSFTLSNNTDVRTVDAVHIEQLLRLVELDERAEVNRERNRQTALNLTRVHDKLLGTLLSCETSKTRRALRCAPRMNLAAAKCAIRKTIANHAITSEDNPGQRMHDNIRRRLVISHQSENEVKEVLNREGIIKAAINSATRRTCSRKLSADTIVEHNLAMTREAVEAPLFLITSHGAAHLTDVNAVDVPRAIVDSLFRNLNLETNLLNSNLELTVLNRVELNAVFRIASTLVNLGGVNLTDNRNNVSDGAATINLNNVHKTRCEVLRLGCLAELPLNNLRDKLNNVRRHNRLANRYAALREVANRIAEGLLHNIKALKVNLRLCLGLTILIVSPSLLRALAKLSNIVQRFLQIECHLCFVSFIFRIKGEPPTLQSGLAHPKTSLGLITS
nr:MAG TPA: hypothetical protein [Caudoviricetes sp.]